MTNLKYLYSLLSRRERATLAALLLLMVLGGALEVCGIGLIFPYVTILQNPEKIGENAFLKATYQALDVQSPRSFCVLLSLGLLAVFIAKGLFTILLNSFQMRFIYSKQLDLGQRLLAGYLYQPYSFFLSVNTSTLIGNLTTSLTQLCGGVIQSVLALATEVFIAAGLIIVLLYMSPAFALLAALFVGVLAFCFTRMIKTRIDFHARENDLRWKAMLRMVNEGLSSAKEVQVLGRQQYFLETYVEECRQFSSSVRNYSLLMQLPRVFLETLAIAGMVFFAIVALLTNGFEKDLFPILAVFAVATVRVVPSANRILQAWNSISFYAPSIEVMRQGLLSAMTEPHATKVAQSPIPFRQAITIMARSFSYPTNSSFCLRDIQVEIGRGQSVAFIGHSGSGKTTLVDLVLGLFPDFEGQVLVDGMDIRGNLDGWRSRIGYIPQSIYLCDSTIIKNVAFGIPDEAIDLEKVRRAIKLAGLEAVVQSQPAGLETVVGDRGICLSGGERQRIGIARALYHDPDLLVLDEATSALDNETERQIVDSILGLSPAKTIIIIAHRLNTVKNCDCVYLMKGGRIIDQGRFEELATRHFNFVNPVSAINASKTQPSVEAANV